MNKETDNGLPAADRQSTEVKPLYSPPFARPPVDGQTVTLAQSGNADAPAARARTAESLSTTPAESSGGLTGKRIAHYRLGAKLGGGVVSAVYQAVDESTQGQVAIKTLLSGADDIMRERFRREAELVSSLEHPHIVTTLEVGEAAVVWPGTVPSNGDDLEGYGESVAYIVMELAEGYSLAQLLERHGRLSATEAAAILAPIGEALAYAHGHDIVHRDVKPSNILLRKEQGNPPGSVRISALEHSVTPLLTDFGIARALDAPELTNAGRTIGTPAFMSPEQCAGEDELDGRSDIYGLGAVLYRCVVGKTPYQGSTTQMLYAHVYEPLLIPEEMVALLPPLALAALQRAMMKDPDQRYQSAAAMAADLALASGRAPEKGQSSGATHTETMPALPVVRKEGQTGGSRVLVPSPVLAGTPAASGPAGSAAGYGRTLPRTSVKLQTAIPRAPDSNPAPRPARRVLRSRTLGRTLSHRWGRALAMTIAATLLVALGLTVFAVAFWIPENGLLPGILSRLDSTAQATATPTTAPAVTSLPVVIAHGSTPQAVQTPSAGQTLTPVGPAATSSAAAATPSAAAVADEEATAGANATPSEGEPTPLGTPQATSASDETPAPAPTPPAVEPATALENAGEALAAGEWEDALDWLLIVRRLDDDFEADAVRGRLVTVYTSLAQAAFDAGDSQSALEWLVLAGAEQPSGETRARLTDAYTAYEQALAAVAEPGDSPDDTSAGEQPIDSAVLEELRAALADAADAVVAGEYTISGSNEAACIAVLYGTVAVGLGANEAGSVAGTSPWLADLIEQCAASRTPPPPRLAGRLIYSSQEGDSYRSFILPVTAPGASTLLIDDASQPRLSSNSRTAAFFNWQGGPQGLFGLELSAGVDAATRSLQFTSHPEDSRDSPPSWSPNGDRLAFSSTRFNDGRHRIYITSADANHADQELRIGKDPAWHPWQDLLVFNGVDDAGQNPGLYLMATDGTQLRQLTDNGNDMRPAWTPDGQHIVFMSSGRHGNWEVYRLDLATLNVTRLTFSESQDGLPTVNPDGTYVAFASDRAGLWEFWYVPLFGGDSIRLSTMNGQMISWLEHGLQWLP